MFSYLNQNCPKNNDVPIETMMHVLLELSHRQLEKQGTGHRCPVAALQMGTDNCTKRLRQDDMFIARDDSELTPIL